MLREEEPAPPRNQRDDGVDVGGDRSNCDTNSVGEPPAAPSATSAVSISLHAGAGGGVKGEMAGRYYGDMNNDVLLATFGIVLKHNPKEVRRPRQFLR